MVIPVESSVDPEITPVDEDLIYHYTTFESFLSIIKNNCVWASDLEAVNDPAELWNARQLLHSVLQVHAESSATTGYAIQRACGIAYLPGRREVAGALQHQYRRFAEGAANYLERYSADSHWAVAIGHVFGVSFCKIPDLLSQWRAYGLNGSGVCVGFDRQKLASAFQAGSEIVDVEYDAKRKTRHLIKLIRHAFERYGAEMKQLDPSDSLFAEPDATVGPEEHGPITITIPEVQKPSSKEDQIIENCLIDVLSALGAIAHTFKVDAFREEQEVRLVFKVPDDASDLESLKLRARGNELIAYMEMKPTRGVLPIRHVIVGPASKSFEQSYALKMLLTQFGHAGVPIERSRFALR
jgi:hypothetical protein